MFFADIAVQLYLMQKQKRHPFWVPFLRELTRGNSMKKGHNHIIILIYILYYKP